MLSFHLFLSITYSKLYRLSFDETLKSMKENEQVFVLAHSSNSFDYDEITSSFTRCSYLMNIDAVYIICDVFGREEEVKKYLQTANFPILFYSKNNNIVKKQFRGFDDEFFSAFFNTQYNLTINNVNTKEELESVYSSTFVALLVVEKNITNALEEFYRNNFASLTVYTCSKGVFEKPGYYLWRYADNEVVELNDISSSDLFGIESKVRNNLNAKFSKLTSSVADLYEHYRKPFAVLMLSMDDFYLNEEQIEIANALYESGINVSYVSIENNEVGSYRYGLPDSLDSTMAIVDVSKGIKKYIMKDKLTKQSALDFYRLFKEGKATQFFKSDVEVPSKEGELVTLTANSLLKLLEQKNTIYLVAFGSKTDDLGSFVNATKPLLAKKSPNIIYGKFNLFLNDWTGPDTTFEILPALVVIKNNKIIYITELPETEEECAEEIKKATINQTEL